jgi:hypothetical protein
MTAFFAALGPARRALAGHLDRLGASLAALGRQLRDRAAGAAGRAAAEAVRQAVTCVLRPPGEGASARAEAPHRREDHPLPGWGEPEPLDGWQQPDEPRRGRDHGAWRHPDHGQPYQRRQAEEPPRPRAGRLA